MPIGRPIANTQVYVLDAAAQPVPIGVPGELYIGGDGAGARLLDRPELTAERFVPDPFSARPGRGCTGRATWRADVPDGTLEFLGRLDHQVKVRGLPHRARQRSRRCWAAHPALRAAVVHVHEDASGDRRLVGYIIPADGARPTIPELRARLKETLPDVHGALAVRVHDGVSVDTQRQGRSQCAAGAGWRSVCGSPPTPWRPGIASSKSWRRCGKRCCGLPSVGVNDNFFDLGGHSLLLVKVHVRLQQIFAREISIIDLFRFPTIESLAQPSATRNPRAGHRRAMRPGARAAQRLAVATGRDSAFLE